MKHVVMKLISTLINILLFLQCYWTYSQEYRYKIISKVQHDIIFNFIQNDTNFKDKVLIYPYLGTTTFRDFDDDVTDLVKLGFNRADLLSEDTAQYIFEKDSQCLIIISYDTIAKYERLSDSLLEAFESNKKFIFFNKDSSRITKDNIDMYSISGFISSIYKKKMCEFKRPIISTNAKFVVLEYFFQCGRLCGKGAVLLLENKNSKWTIKKYLLFTQS
jgi:hypothetical protein